MLRHNIVPLLVFIVFIVAYSPELYSKDRPLQAMGTLLSAVEERREADSARLEDGEIRQAPARTFYVLEVKLPDGIYRFRYGGYFGPVALPWTVGEKLRIVYKKAQYHAVLPESDRMVRLQFILRRKEKVEPPEAPVSHKEEPPPML